MFIESDLIMHGEKKDNSACEKILQETAEELKLNQKSLIDSTSCVVPEKKVGRRSKALHVYLHRLLNANHNNYYKCVGVNL